MPEERAESEEINSTVERLLMDGVSAGEIKALLIGYAAGVKESRRVDEVVARLAQLADLCDRPDSLNEVIDDCRQESRDVKIRTFALCVAKAAQLGAEWDKERKIFVAQPARTSGR